MTRRKPDDMSFENWTDRLVREAQERGAFSDLPGAGKPIPGLDRPWSAERWVADMARREGVDLSVTLPAPLRLRRRREQLLAGLASLTTEQQVRDVVGGFNDEVREAFRRPTTGGPPMTVGVMDVEEVLARWQAARPAPAPPDPADPADPSEPPPVPPRRHRWPAWLRRRRRHD